MRTTIAILVGAALFGAARSGIGKLVGFNVREIFAQRQVSTVPVQRVRCSVRSLRDEEPAFGRIVNRVERVGVERVQQSPAGFLEHRFHFDSRIGALAMRFVEGFEIAVGVLPLESHRNRANIGC